MAIPLMVRLEDDLHAKLTEQSRRTHAPMNRIVNDALRLMFSGAIGESSASSSGSSHIVATFGERARHAEAALSALSVPQENLHDLQTTATEALRLVFSCAFAAMIAIDPSLTPVASIAQNPERNVSTQEEIRA